MVAELEALWKAQRDLDNYWRQVSVAGQWAFGSEGFPAFTKNMEDLKKRVVELAENGRLGIGVQRGYTEENGQRYPFTPQNWKNVHRAVWDGVSGQMQVINGAPTAWSDFIVPTFKDIGDEIDKGKEAIESVGEKLDFLTSPAGMLLVLAILLVAFAWKVA